jgi:hypothetical protein
MCETIDLKGILARSSGQAIPSPPPAVRTTFESQGDRMGKINWSRVVLGGIVAGIVIDVLGYIVDGVLLAPRWADGMAALGHTAFTARQIVSFNILGIVAGIALIWMYAAIRPRYGAGIRTATTAAIWFWIIGYLLPNLGFMWVPHLFSHHLTVYTTAGNLVETIVGALAGAALYREA